MTSAVSLPRQVLPGTFWMLTRRCTQRQFLLRPDRETNAIFTYCLAEAAQRYGIDVILPVAMSNHHHTDFFDRYGTAIEFVEQFHKMSAKALNSYRGRRENFWSSEPPSLVRLIDPSDVMDKLVYTATNPVKDGLVERVRDWPGFNGLSALVEGRTIVARRPRHFFRSDGAMPEVVELELRIPPELGDSESVRRDLAARVAAEEDRIATERAGASIRVVGRRAILRQSWRALPQVPESARRRKPRLAARRLWQRLEAIRRDREFQAAYRRARAALLAGTPIPFPIGTYWLRRFVHVPIATAKEN